MESEGGLSRGRWGRNEGRDEGRDEEGDMELREDKCRELDRMVYSVGYALPGTLVAIE